MVWHTFSIPLFRDDRTRVVRVYYPLQIVIIDWLLMFVNQTKGSRLTGCGMGPWLVLVSPCFRENVVATCKIECVLCSLDNLLQKNVKSNFKMALI